MIGRERLDAILRARKGTLEETPYPIVLLALAVNEKSAVLQLRRNQLEKQIVFDAGSPVECRSNIATETLGRFLMSNGKISEADCHTSLSQSASRGVPLGEVLVERKLLKPTDLYRALQQNLGRKLLEPFSWKSGTFEISFDAPAVSSALRVKVPQLIVTGIVKVDTQESADEAAAAATGKYLSIAAEPLFGLDEVRLSGDQQKVVEASRRGLSFDDIRAKSGIDAEDVNRIAAALLLLGVVNVTDRPVLLTAAAKPKTVVAEPAVRAPTAAAADEVIAAFLSYPRKDAFDLLAVAEDAAPPLIMQAFLQLADKFLPSKFDERAADALRDKAQQVFLAAARAYAELSDAARREALVKKRVKLREQAAAAAKAGTAALIDPEQLCRNGRALAEAGKLREALSSFELAAECDAQNGTYSAEAAWCRFQLRVTPAANALKLLKNAIRIDPECAVAYLYAGKLQAVLGHRLEAEAYLNRAAMLMPKDLRVVDALKALR